MTRRAQAVGMTVAGLTFAISAGACSSNPTPSSGTPSASAPSMTDSVATATHSSPSAASSTSSKQVGAIASSTAGTVAPNQSVLPNPTGFSSGDGRAIGQNGCVPTKLVASSIGVDERIVPLGTNAQGQIYPPPKTTMWFDKSPRPGANGVSVIAGHVEYDGPDNFYNLNQLPIGARVSVTCSNGQVLALKVREKASILKTALTTDQRVWGASATPVVALITCDRASRVVNDHHLNNYVVWTVPA